MQLESDQPTAYLAGITVFFLVHAGNKNPYCIEFPPTDIRGATTLNRNDFQEQFERHWSVALMDHDGTLSSASQYVTVKLGDSSYEVRKIKSILELPTNSPLYVPVRRITSSQS